MLPRLSLLYLAAPAAFFLAGWVRPSVGIPVGLALAAALAVGLVRHVRLSHRRSTRLDRVLAVSLVVVLALVSGAGAVGHQRLDWYKHNAVLHDLTVEPWPVVYRDRGPEDPGLLSYGVGYYLPAAAFGKLAGLDGAHAALLVWTALGLGLTAAWLSRLSGRIAWIAMVVWLGVNGMDALGVLLVGGRSQDLMQWWSGFAQYSSNPSLLFWTPQHGLAGWIGAALAVHGHEHRWPAPALGAVAAVVVLWSPFAALGLAPLLVSSLLRRRSRLAGLAVGAALTVPFVVVASAYLLGSERAGVPAGWIWESLGPGRGPAMWALFVAVEVGVPLVALAALYRPGGAAEEIGARGAGDATVWLWPAAVTLVMLPLAYVGNFNDLVSRTSVPSLFVVAVLVLRLPWTRRLAGAAPAAVRVLAVSLLVGALQPAADVTTQLMWTADAERPAQPPRELSLTALPEGVARQYVVPLEGPYVRWLAPAAALPPG